MPKNKTTNPLRPVAIMAILLTTFLLPACQVRKSTGIQQPKLVITPAEMNPDEQEIAEAFENAITGREDVLTFLIFNVNIDFIDISDSNEIALIWLSLSDPQTGELIPAEAGLAVAQKRNLDENVPSEQADYFWEITLQADSQWDQALASVPPELMDVETLQRYSTRQQSIPHAATVYTGYHLPWAAGESKRLSGSIGHVYLYKTCPTTCMYAFDFADGTMWPILAARGGRVKYAVWQYPNGNSKHANYLVLEDTSTNPTTYQVYMHLAQDSIPVDLRTPGAVVTQGQRIGVVDDTGVSTGHHLHFHVHTNAAVYWGTSVDIVFDEVKVNGGRPRTCNEANLFPSLGRECQKSDFFTSENNDLAVPTGDITSPAENTILSNQTLDIAGWAKDDSGIHSSQVLINFAGNWVPASQPVPGDQVNASIDLCELEVPDGSFFVALKIMDNAGKEAPGMPGLKTYVKQYKCPLPPPRCTAAPNQIGLFELPEFQGDCALFDLGTHESSSLSSALPFASIGSIQVGADTVARITNNITQIPVISNSLDATAWNLTIDQIVTMDVEDRPLTPSPQTIYIDNLSQGIEIPADAPVTVSWEVQDISFEYRALLSQADKMLEKMEWSKTDHWEIPGLQAGNYTFYLDVHNLMGDASSTIDFVVRKVDLPPVTELAPLPVSVESTSFPIGWTVLDGLHDLQYVEIRFRENDQDWQLLGSFPPQINETLFTGNPASVYNFQIRAVDLAGNQEEFHAGTSTQVTVAQACSADSYDLSPEGDDTLQRSNTLEFNRPQRHNICEAGDHDFFAFVGEKDSVYLITARSLNQNTAIQFVLSNLAGDEPLSQSETEKIGETTQLTWTAPATGFYFIDGSSIDPQQSGNDVEYEIEIKKIVQVHTPGVIASTLLVPLLWLLLKILNRFIALFSK